MIIYLITNVVNKKVYVGQTIQSLKERWYGHTADARHGQKTKLANAIRKHGVENFTIEQIDSAATLTDLNLLEEQWIEHFDSILNGYNIRNGGLNKLHNAESIEKMKISQKAAHARRRAAGTEGGWTRCDGGPMLGKTHPKKGKESTKWSDEAKQKHSDLMKIINKRTAEQRKGKSNFALRGKTWKMINGKRVWQEKQA